MRNCKLLSIAISVACCVGVFANEEVVVSNSGKYDLQTVGEITLSRAPVHLLVDSERSRAVVTDLSDDMVIMDLSKRLLELARFRLPARPTVVADRPSVLKYACGTEKGQVVTVNKTSFATETVIVYKKAILDLTAVEDNLFGVVDAHASPFTFQCKTNSARFIETIEPNHYLSIISHGDGSRKTVIGASGAVDTIGPERAKTKFHLPIAGTVPRFVIQSRRGKMWAFFGHGVGVVIIDDSNMARWDNRSSTSWVTSVAFSGNDEKVAIATNDGKIAIWSIADKAKVCEQHIHKQGTVSVQFWDNDQVVSIGSDSRVVVTRIVAQRLDAKEKK